MPRILILTASMGEGHNTAARNIREGLLAEGLDPESVLTADPYTRTNPIVNRLMQEGYTMAINRYPAAWKVLFNFLSKPGVVEGMGPMLAELKAGVKSLIAEFRPDLLVSTYPIFSFLVRKLARRDASIPPLFTMITDSTMINSAWFRCHCTGFIVADNPTADVLRRGRVPEELIHVIGFPVSSVFENLTPAPHPGNGPWKVIFFPGGRTDRAIATLERLGAIPSLRVTVVTGRRAALHRSLQAARLPAVGELLGWTDRMPELMAGHHVFVGKAGGATVQEAIAARIPFIVSHIVPGQEEGNIALIERSGIGTLASGPPGRVGDILEGVMGQSGALWSAWRHNIEKIARPAASRDIACFLLARCPSASKAHARARL